MKFGPDITKIVVEGEKRDADSEKEDISEPKVTWDEAEKGLPVFVKFGALLLYMSANDVMGFHFTDNEFIQQ